MYQTSFEIFLNIFRALLYCKDILLSNFINVSQYRELIIIIFDLSLIIEKSMIHVENVQEWFTLLFLIPHALSTKVEDSFVKEQWHLDGSFNIVFLRIVDLATVNYALLHD